MKIQAIMEQQTEWNRIRPEMAVTVGDLANEQNSNLFCNINYAQIDKTHQAFALTDSGKLRNL